MRQYIRHPSEMPICYKLNALDDIPGNEHQKLHDISSGGLSFHSDQKINPGNSLHIQIVVDPPPFEADGIVVWCKKENDGYQVGLQFNDTDVEFGLRMIEQLCHIEQYRHEVLKNEGRWINSEVAAREWIEKYAKDFPR